MKVVGEDIKEEDDDDDVGQKEITRMDGEEREKTRGRKESEESEEESEEKV